MSVPDAVRAALAHVVIVEVRTSGMDPQQHTILSVQFQKAKCPSRVTTMECSSWEIDLGNMVPKWHASYDPAVLEQHGWDQSRLHDSRFPAEQQGIRHFFELLGQPPEGGWVLCARHPVFHLNFLRAAGKRAGIWGPRFPFAARSIDLHTLAMAVALTKGEPIPDDHLPMFDAQMSDRFAVADEFWKSVAALIPPEASQV